MIVKNIFVLLLLLLWLPFIFGDGNYEGVGAEYTLDAEGIFRVRPWNCCTVCGDNYSYYDGRCFLDPDHLLQDHEYPQDIHQPWLIGSDQCCFFCGFKAGDFAYSKSERKCIAQPRHQLQQSVQGSHSFLSFSTAKCAVCEILIKAVGGMKDVAINKIERELDSICDVTFYFQHFCHHLLQSHMDEIKNFLENKISTLNLCQKFNFCSKSTTLTNQHFNITCNTQLHASPAESALEKQVMNLAFPITITSNKKTFKYQPQQWEVSTVFPDACAALNKLYCEKLCILSGGIKVEFFNDEASFKTLLAFSMSNKNILELFNCGD